MGFGGFRGKNPDYEKYTDNFLILLRTSLCGKYLPRNPTNLIRRLKRVSNNYIWTSPAILFRKGTIDVQANYIINDVMDITEFLSYEDMVWETMKYLSYKDRRMFAFSCKHLTKMYYKKRMGYTKIEGVDVFFGKKEILDEILNAKSKIVSINAPPSWGKSLLAILIPLYLHPIGSKVLNNNERYIITVPTKLISMFIDEIKKHVPQSLNVKKPNKSYMVVDSITIKSHKQYLMNNILSDYNRVILTSHCRSNKLQIQDIDNMNVIVDEAHMGSVALTTFLKYKTGRIFYFSATKLSLPSKYSVNVHNIIVNRTDISDILPSYIFKSSIKNLSTIIKSRVPKYDKIVIFVQNSDNIEDIKEIIEKITDIRVNIFKFVKLVKKINLFEKAKDKAILVVPYSSTNVGFSIKADCAILDKCEGISYENLYQIVSRVLRITNYANKINITVLYGDGDDFFMRVKQSLVSIKLKYDIILPQSYLYKNARDKTLQILNELKIDYKTLSPIELIMAIAPNAYILKNVFKENGLLESNLRKDILCRLFY